MTIENYIARQCSVDGCSGKHSSMGYCDKHRMQVRRGGIKQEATKCKHCSEAFKAADVQTMYCSKKCKRAAWVLINQDKIAEYRSREVRREPTHAVIYAGYCNGCGKPFVSRRKRAYCSDECLPSAVYISTMKDAQQCRCCGVSYQPESTGGRPRVYCSEACDTLVKVAAKRIYRSQRDSRIKSVTVERVDPFKVFDRDRWKCQLCGIKTPKTKRGTYDDNAPELDHILPLAKGGEHSYRNTQCACRKCNRIKSDSPMGQMLMFG